MPRNQWLCSAHVPAPKDLLDELSEATVLWVRFTKNAGYIYAEVVEESTFSNRKPGDLLWFLCIRFSKYESELWYQLQVKVGHRRAIASLDLAALAPCAISREVKAKILQTLQKAQNT